MAIIFTAPTADAFLAPGAIPYTGTAQSRDTNYTDDEIAFEIRSNGTETEVFTPVIETSGDTLWLHFRAVFPTGSNNSSADGLFLTVLDERDNAIGAIDWNNGNIRARAGNSNFGSEFNQVPGTVYTIDFFVDRGGGTTASAELYVDNVLVSSATEGLILSAEAIRRVRFDLNDMLGVGVSNTFVYISEFFMDDADSTVGCRMSVRDATANGNYTEMVGSYTALLDGGDSDVLVAENDQDRFSWTFPAYTGDVSSGTNVRAVVAYTAVFAPNAGVNTFTPFLRMSGTDYVGVVQDESGGWEYNTSYAFTLNPETGNPWDITEVDGFEMGVAGGEYSPATAQIVGVTGNFVDSPASGQTITYSSAPLGTAQDGRVLFIVAPFFDGSTTSSTPTGVTVGGNAATLVASAHLTGTTACGISIWKYQDDGALGSTADIVVTHDVTRTSRSIAVVEASIGNDILIDSGGDSDTTASIVDTTLTTTGATTLLYASIWQNGASAAPPAPFTDGNYNYDENSNEWVHIGWDNSPSGSDETFGMPTTGAGLRGAYVAIAIE